MKKKLFLTVICLLLVVLCLTGCTDYSQQFDKINKLINAAYSKVKLDVTVTQDTEQLESWFEVVYNNDDSSTVTFEIQRLSTFQDGQLPDDYITTYNGSAVVKNGQVTSVSGDVPSDVDLAIISSVGIRFSDGYFSSVKDNGNSLTIKVAKPQAFLGQANFTCKDNSMTATVSYGSLLNFIRVQYNTVGGAKVVLMYTFTPPVG